MKTIQHTVSKEGSLRLIWCLFVHLWFGEDSKKHRSFKAPHCYLETEAASCCSLSSDSVDINLWGRGGKTSHASYLGAAQRYNYFRKPFAGGDIHTTSFGRSGQDGCVLIIQQKKKAITGKRLQTDPPRDGNWLEIIKEIQETERRTFLLRLKDDFYEMEKMDRWFVEIKSAAGSSLLVLVTQSVCNLDWLWSLDLLFTEYNTTCSHLAGPTRSVKDQKLKKQLFSQIY